ncbi:MAG: peptidoglycan-binding domain-containing protein [Candidatus Moraniibacteriota bacterium]
MSFRSCRVWTIRLFLFALLFGFGSHRAEAFSGVGTGTAETPFLITTCTQLQEMQDDLEADYKLRNDINCDVAPYNTGSGFEPVGGSSSPFEGSFDGAGHVIDNLFIDRSSTSNVGLFGFVGDEGLISNVGLTNVDITGSSYVGGLVGRLSAATVEYSYVEGTVEGASNVGGLAGGAINGIVRTSYARVSVFSTGSAGDEGGLVGLLNGASAKIENSYATGDVSGSGLNVYAGGLVGLGAGGLIENSYATGDVTVSNAGGSYAGGLVGITSITINNSYATGTATAAQGDANDGGFAGSNGGIITNSYSVGVAGALGGGSSSVTNNQSISDFYETDPLHDVYLGTPSWDFDSIWFFNDASSLPVLHLRAASEEDTDTSERAKISSFEVSRYSDNSKCPQKIRVTVKGHNFDDDDTEVFVGGKEASSVDVKSSRKLEALFCLDKFSKKDKTSLKKTLSVKNPDTKEIKANNKIDLSAYKKPKVSLDPDASFDESTNAGTTNIQKVLVALGFLSADDIVGSYGPKTVAAVKAFQAKQDISQTGNVGPKTVEALQKAIGK